MHQRHIEKTSGVSFIERCVIMKLCWVRLIH